MRRTLILDDDVVAKLEKIRAERHESLEDLVNEALRRGLGELAGGSARREPFRTKSVSLGRCLVGDLDSVNDALAFAEGPAFR